MRPKEEIITIMQELVDIWVEIDLYEVTLHGKFSDEEIDYIAENLGVRITVEDITVD